VVAPILDALDEVVKGEARKGGEEFLTHIFELAHAGTLRGVLACRDYYLTTDRGLVCNRAFAQEFAQLYIGPFSHQDTRKYLQVRTGLEPKAAADWTEALEREGRKVVGEDSDLQVIRHPVVLKTLAQYITELPDDSRVAAASKFELTRTDIFGNIVDELLKRERDKLFVGWDRAFQGQLAPEWRDPFEFPKQRQLLRKLTLLSAQAGGSPNLGQDSGMRHGLFLHSKGVPPEKNVREAFEKLLLHLLGTPEPDSTVSEDKRAEVQRSALKHLADAYSAHILAERGQSEELVFALSHRFYFDYFLADALLEQVEAALQGKLVGENLIQWCIDHHTTDKFATCLDFLQWDARVARDGPEQLRSFLADSKADPVLAGYLVSLALAVFLRRINPSDRVVEHLRWDTNDKLELLLMKDFLPEDVSDLSMQLCSFPNLSIAGLELSDIAAEACDFKRLTVTDCRINQCKFRELECEELHLEGTVIFSGTTLDFECPVTIGLGAHVELNHCSVSDSLRHQLEARQGGYDVAFKELKVVEPVAEEKLVASRLTAGRRFVNRLMALLRKEGRAEFAVYRFKLRSKTPGNESQFDRVLELLGQRSVLKTKGSMVIMTQKAAEQMYYHRLFGRAGYDSHDEYWQPLVGELDNILAGSKEQAKVTRTA